MKKKVLFLHGSESKPGGAKSAFLVQHGFEVLNPPLPKNDFLESCNIAQQCIDEHHPDVVVGSSRGGAVAMAIDPKGARMVLIAPAWVNFKGPSQIPPKTSILHSRSDDIIPYANSVDLSINSDATLVDCGKGHRMNDPDALLILLEAVKDATE